MPLAENTGLASISPEGFQLLPLSNWYPTPSVAGGGDAARITPGTDSLTKLQTARLQLPADVAPGGTVTASVDYHMPVAENTGLASVSPEGLQLLPLSNWYPTPNTTVAPRGADYAPLRLTVKGYTSEAQGEGE